MASGVKCGVCDYANLVPTPTCKNCNARLMKKRIGSQSKKAQSRVKKKRKKNQCSGNKVKYASKIEAKISAKKIHNKTGRMSRIYRCKTCSGYHLTKFKG